MDRVVALAGRLVDRGDEQTPRFPLENVGYVRGQIRRLFEELEVRALICSAACGADLIALEQAELLGIKSRVILPFSPERFRELSVICRQGNWTDQFDRTIKGLNAIGELVTLDWQESNTESFLAANSRILNETTALATQLAAKPAAIVVWEGSRGPTDLTAHLAEQARERGFEVFEITTLRVERA